MPRNEEAFLQALKISDNPNYAACTKYLSFVREIRSIYRLYDDLCANRLTLLTYECEYIFRRGSKRWQLSQIPDPQDADPVRYAVLASLVEALVDVFNWKMELGIRRGGRPCDQSEERATNFTREVNLSWTQGVSGIAQRVNLINRESEPFAKSDENFLGRNIEASAGHMYTTLYYSIIPCLYEPSPESTLAKAVICDVYTCRRKEIRVAKTEGKVFMSGHRSRCINEPQGSSAIAHPHSLLHKTFYTSLAVSS
ncbi:uncharacterized protein RAG0_14113 [Rhynchosporium agropyri]|uniref:Uncharacterized protein n=1 Tax=Rhynchosporium agropyri TaxID=914238 RepID=A0A1E1LFX5_9HELO|nr:uncharacterized protein RAG0_14113 [Rhynchosporium agropyri]